MKVRCTRCSSVLEFRQGGRAPHKHRKLKDFLCYCGGQTERLSYYDSSLHAGFLEVDVYSTKGGRLWYIIDNRALQFKPVSSPVKISEE